MSNYIKTLWVNNVAPYINALHLNNIENGIFNNSAAIQTLVAGENAKGIFTPAAGTEYPATSAINDSWYISGLTPTGYTYTAGDLSGKTSNNQDKILYTASGWVLIDSGVTEVTNVTEKVADDAAFMALTNAPETVLFLDGRYGSNMLKKVAGGVDNGGTVRVTTDGTIYELQYDDVIDMAWFGVTEDNDSCGWEDSAETTVAKSEAEIVIAPDSMTVGKAFKAWNYASGIADSAVAGSFMLGADGVETRSQVSSYSNDAHMADYTNRDSVALFAQNNSQPALVASVDTTFDATHVASAAFAGHDIKVGMIVEMWNPVPYVGKITEVSGTSLKVSAWYKTGVTPSETGTPANGSHVYVNMFTKIWGANVNAIIPANGGANSASIAELGIQCNKVGSGINSVGIDVINLSGVEKPGYAYKARGGFLRGYYSDSTENGFESENANNASFYSNQDNTQSGSVIGYYSTGAKTGFKSVNDDVPIEVIKSGNSKFKVNNQGQISGSYFGFQTVTSSATLSIDSVLTIVTTPNVTITLPVVSGHAGKIMIISFNSAATGGKVNRNGNDEAIAVGTTRFYVNDGTNWTYVTFE